MSPVLERNRQRAERILERDYSKLRKTTIRGVESRLALRYVAPGRRFDDLDLDAFYNQAWHGLYLRLAEGEEIENHAGFLVHATYCRAVDEIRRSQPARVDPAALEELGVEPDVDAMLDDHTRLTQFMEGMRERLTDRERQAATLCYIQGHTRPQTAEILGVSPKRMEKLMDSVSLKIGALLEDIRRGGWCESRSSLMKAYAFGVLDPDGERWDLAVAHLKDCPGCRRYVRGLRGIAAVAPPIGIPIAAMAALGGAGAAGAAAGSSAGAGSGASVAGSSAGTAGSTASAAGSTASAGSAAGAGSTAAAGAGFGGIGATGIAAAAAVVAAASVAGFAATRGGDKPVDPPAPKAAVLGTVTSAPAATTTKAATKKKAAVKKKAKKKTAKKKPQTVTPPTTTASNPAPTTTATTPVTQTAQPVTQQQSAPAQRAAPRATGDGSQEFGFEK